MAKLVTLRCSWAGMNFSYGHGDVVELEDYIADAMLADGRAVDGGESDATIDSSTVSVNNGANKPQRSKSSSKS